MFDDFRSTSSAHDRKRMGGSVLAATILYGSLGAILIGGTTAATTTVVESLTQVEFAPPPPPPPPPPPVPEVKQAQPLASVRPKVKRHELKPPKEVPKEKPKESNAELAPSDDKGPLDGFLNGVEGGTGTGVANAPVVAPPPPPKPEPLIRAVALRSNAHPAYSASAKRKEIEGTVVVMFDVLENGTVANARIVSGPEELRDSVLKAVVTWRFEPAKRGGKAIRTREQKAIKFELTDA
jgi:protein TonB